MAIQTEPTRIQIPFADSGTKNVIPDTNSTPSASQAASWTDGFPAQCSLPLSAGGIPPARADFNGLFNTMSQSLRFTQEGGVWAWDATVDYGTNRVVLGSDGKLYWSVAQSGPNLGGAQDPTTDNGTYWQAPYAKTMPALVNSAAVATTEWVRLAVGPKPLYVDPVNGDDAKDGLSQANAVKTIAQALLLIDDRTGATCDIYLASGTYSEDVEVVSKHAVFYLQGNVSVGKIVIRDGATAVFLGSSYTLSATKTGDTALHVYNDSYFYTNCTINITCGTSSFAIQTNFNSFSFFNSSINITASSVSFAIDTSNLSHTRIEQNVSISSTSIPTCIACSYNSFVELFGGLSTPSNVTNNGVYCNTGSVIRLEGGNLSIYGLYPIKSETGSLIIVNNTASCILSVVGAGEALSATYGGTIFFGAAMSGSPALSVVLGSSAKHALIAGAYSGIAMRLGSISFSGTVTGETVRAVENSTIAVAIGASISGTVTGKRYYAGSAGAICTNGGGANRFPGTVAGTVDAAQFGMYY